MEFIPENCTRCGDETSINLSHTMTFRFYLTDHNEPTGVLCESCIEDFQSFMSQ